MKTTERLSLLCRLGNTTPAEDRIIDAAPDLLAALRDLREAWVKAHAHSCAPETYFEATAFLQADAAIAKAEGRA